MNQDNVLSTNIVESGDETSDVDIDFCDVEETELKNKISGEMSNKATAKDSTDFELDIGTSVQETGATKCTVELAVNKMIENSDEAIQKVISDKIDESRKEYFLQSNDENLREVVAMKKEMEQIFSVGSEFSDIDELRARAQELGKKYSCPITTDKAYQKLQTITLICQRGKKMPKIS